MAALAGPTNYSHAAFGIICSNWAASKHDVHKTMRMFMFQLLAKTRLPRISSTSSNDPLPPPPDHLVPPHPNDVVSPPLDHLVPPHPNDVVPHPPDHLVPTHPNDVVPPPPDHLVPPHPYDVVPRPPDHLVPPHPDEVLGCV
ncbi:hypothetical protein H257_18165 [Aphanomyces astaci]|uniref:Uncharacterized protein n=1 Tax=Aphanomyces astaci TaxID=112090 RepID=W4FDZ4_APHAT|nr:hypothetical protein H257_18165 [Aphanomyces astaci]ETV65041.1 hypothetical protein H257_18165 [Aphanomyces astaci]|eukprot:XP_009845477.1 hypothetical protein H257_18165 [Aphanomyces astaci]